MTASLQHAASHGDDLPQGYKRTEVGVIPVEWEVKRLGDVLKVYHGKSQHDVVDENGIYPILATGGQIGKANTFLYDKPSVLIGRKGTIDFPQYMDSPFWTIDTLFFTEIKQSTCAKYIFYLFNTIDWNGYNEASGVPSLNASTIEKITFKCPPLPEQTAIATVLSDVDGLIASLTALIAKKRAVKHATMQQLLTGKTRLAGFTGAWEVKRLGDVATCYSGGTPSTSNPEYYNGNIPWITSSDLNARYICEVENRISELGLIHSSAKIVKKYTLLIALYGATAGVVAISNINGAINQAILAVIPNNCNVEFLFFYFELYKEHIVFTYTQGGQPNLSGDIIKSLQIPLPPLPEQTAIAAILTDMDTDITTLETRLAKTKALKTGMCQELLTGKTRLL
jgi:type I restriction enzyme S subunit